MNIALVAGEASGDLLAGLLLDGLKGRWPALQSYGIGGAQMTQRGFEAWWSCEKLAVRGYVEVLRHYAEIIAIRRQLKNKLLRLVPDVFVGVDAPDFNLDLARDLRTKGIKTIQFVSPSIWAWRGERIQRIKESVDHVLCIFPFEPALYAKHGISASYVGHPLASHIPLHVDRAQACHVLGLDVQRPVIAVLPGSRRSEIDYMGETFAQVIARMLTDRPNLQIVVPAIPALHAMVQSVVTKHLNSDQLPKVRVLIGQSHVALAACQVSLVASGTATLEAALFKRPMVIAYKMHGVSWWMMRGKRYQPWVGLPNILSKAFIVPEFLQDQATPQALADATLAWLEDSQRYALTVEKLTDLHQVLRLNTAELAAEQVAKVCAT